MRRWLLLFLFLTCVVNERKGYAVGTLPTEGILSNLPGLLSGEVATVVVKTFGLAFDHRPMEPATPLGNALGFDIGIEATLIQTGNQLTDILSSKGIDIPSIPVLPAVKMLNIHKGLSDIFDIGFSVFTYQNYLIWGVDAKLVVVNSEEGATWAIRLGRNSVHVPAGTVDFGAANLSVDFDVVTWTPALVISKKLDFADPYIGFGYQYATGAVNLTTNSGTTDPGLDSVVGTGGGFLAFLGLSLRPPNLGLRLTLEGAYSSAGFNSLGTKIGFSF